MADSSKPQNEEGNTSIVSQTEDQNDPLVTQPSNSRPTTLNTGGQKADPPQEKPKRTAKASSSDQDGSSVKRNDSDEKESPTDAAARGKGILTSEQFESKEDASPQSHKDREERIRQYKERLVEDRSRRLQELELASAHAQKIREMQEEDRKRRIEELRIKDIERRHAVEERKRQIWEAEQERKEAILRRNLDREAKIEARRNAHRNVMSFAFGSSTPRTIDLEPGYVHYYRTAGNALVANGRSSFERDLEYYKRRPPSADILDSRQGEDLMTRSMVSLPSSATRGRRRTDLTPTIPASYRDLSLPSTSPGNQTKRALSMSRLDMLSRPRRRTIDASASAAPDTSTSKSTFNLPNPHRFVKSGEGHVSRSMMHLASPPPPVPPPRSPARTKKRLQTVPLSQSGKQLSKSMVHLTPPPPRPNRATRLRALVATRKEGIVDSPDQNGTHKGTGASKETSHSPSRPRSSMSLASEKSANSSHQSAVGMRVRSAPRRPRPASIAGTVPDNATPPRPPPRQSRTSERKAAPVGTPPTRPHRAKSAGPVNETEIPTKPPIVQKPATKPQAPASDKAEEKNEENVQETGIEDQQQQKGSPANKPRITSEEAAKAALAEKRRLAREQAEREAELEKQRQEQLRREEEEKKQREEEEQRKMEEEHARLVETLRRQEDEKLKKAIEEQQKLEEEQRLQREEEAKQRAEREEQERKAKEEAERQRKELEEKLVKEEAERAERKKRVEAIMKRTRGKDANRNGNGSQEIRSEGNSDSEKNSDEAKEEQNDHAATVNNKNEHNAMLDGFVRSDGNPGAVDNGNLDLFGSPGESRTNGYGGHEEENLLFKQQPQHLDAVEKTNPTVDNLLDFDPLSSNANDAKTNASADFNGLLDFGVVSDSADRNAAFSNADVNSNRTTGNPFISFEENANFKPETTAVADLLS